MVGEPYSAGFGFGNHPSPEVFVYRLLGPATDPSSWERTLVDRVGTFEAQVVDVDGDGLSDIVGHEGNPAFAEPRAHGRISWWQSTTVRSGGSPPPPPGSPPLPPPAGPCRGPDGSSLGCACARGTLPACTGDTFPRSMGRHFLRAGRIAVSVAWRRVRGDAPARSGALSPA